MSHNARPGWTAVTVVLVLGVLGIVASGTSAIVGGGPTPATTAAPGASPFAVPTSQPYPVLSIMPTQVSQGQTISVQTSVSGGTPPYSFTYSGLPSGCNGYSTASFSCTPNGPGTYNVQVTVTDVNGNTSTSPSVSLDVTGSNNGNGNGNGNNSSNSISGLFSNLGGFLSLLLVFGLVGFATWILLVIGVWVIAIVLLRRLPKRGEAGLAVATVRCAACSASIPAASKFCAECGAAIAPKRG